MIPQTRARITELTITFLGSLLLCANVLGANSQATQRELLDDFWERSQMSGNPGAGIWRFDLDVDGDGQPEILLANQELAGKHGDMEWEVYKCVKGPQYRFLGRLSFPRVAFRLLQNPARVEALWFNDEHDRDASGRTVRSADLATYLVTATRITENSMTHLREADIETKLAQMEAWHETAKPRLLGAKADQEGKFENPTWYDLETGEPAQGVTNLEGLVVDTSLSAPEETTSAAEWNERGLKLMQQKDYDSAMLNFLRADALAGQKNAEYANNAGFALYKAQRYVEAVEWFKKTIGIDPKRAVAYLNLGDALAKLNRNAEAREAYTKYLDLAPNSKSAADTKKKLQALSPHGHAADQSLLDHLLSVLEVPPDADARWPLPTKVLRMELDVTVNQKPALFLGTTWGMGRTGMPWVVYTPQADGRYRPLGVIYFHYMDFYYSSDGSFICSLIHVTGSKGPAFMYYRIGRDGIRDITDDESFRPSEDPIVMMRAWQKQGRPPVYEDTLADLKASATPRWKDADTEKLAPSIGKLDAKVTETGACSAEKFLQDYRNAGCVPKN